MLRKNAEKLEHVVGAYTHDVGKLTPVHPEYVASIPDEEPSGPCSPATARSPGRGH